MRNGDSSDEEMWEEMMDGCDSPYPNVRCLFCQKTYNNATDIFNHCTGQHGFNIHALQRDLGLDCFGYIKMINFIRRKMPTVEHFMRDMMDPSLWKDDHFMMPAICDDPLLCVDIDDITKEAQVLCQRHAILQSESQSVKTCPHGVVSTSTTASVCHSNVGNTRNDDGGNLCVRHAMINTPKPSAITNTKPNIGFSTQNTIISTQNPVISTPYPTISTPNPAIPTPYNHTAIAEPSNVPARVYNDLLTKYNESEKKVKIIQDEMTRCLTDMTHMKQTYARLVTAQPGPMNNVAALTTTEDDGYFSGYSHFSIHHEMLSDRIRTEAYRDFMMKNPGIVKDKTVLDVGCGTAILSMFAAKAGASKTTGIDQSDVIIHAIDIVKENQLTDKITLVKGRLEDTVLPIEKYDVIVSEWMGYFLLYESMLETVLYARDKYLKSMGMVYPDRCSISIAAVDDQESRKSYLEFWDDVYGFKMTSLKQDVSREASIMVVHPDSIVSHACIIKNLDIMTCEVDDLQFTTNFTLTITKDCSMTGIVAYFDVFFERGLASPIILTTSPSAPATHWKQTVFYLPTLKSMKEGEIITGSLTCRKMPNDPRSLTVVIKMFDETYNYAMP